MPHSFGYITVLPQALRCRGNFLRSGTSGFTSFQMLAGAKLASASFPELQPDPMPVHHGLIHRSIHRHGRFKASFTLTTFQWALLMFGFVFICIPIALSMP